MLWDRGTWRSDERVDLDSGKLDFVLDGDKLKGAWTLVRMGGRKERRRQELAAHQTTRSGRKDRAAIRT
jgi:bifunctional non-homologous end joining protein LigD